MLLVQELTALLLNSCLFLFARAGFHNNTSILISDKFNRNIKNSNVYL